VSAPPLPEAFGNYALKGIAEIVPPPDISWLPQTAGWAWLGAGLALWLGYRGWRRLRRWYRNRYRREALQLLAGLAAQAAPEALLPELNRLLKLAALAAHPREQVAGLTGRAWTGFLNGCCPDPPFSADQCALLAVDAYRHRDPDAATARALLDASDRWLRSHWNPLDD